MPELSEVEDEAIVTEGRGVGSSHLLLVAYDRLLQGLDRIFQYHFEFLNLGYGAYLVFYELCRQAFPDIDDQTIAKMVAGIDVFVLRPDEELKRLARLAIELGVEEGVKAAGDEDELRATLSSSTAGTRWLTDFERRRSRGSTSPTDRVSSTTTTARGSTTQRSRSRPLATTSSASSPARTSLGRMRRSSPSASGSPANTERSCPEEARGAFDESLALARTVFPFVENHNFYIDHRYMTLFWNKAREFGRLLAAHGFLVDGEDVFYLRTR